MTEKREKIEIDTSCLYAKVGTATIHYALGFVNEFSAKKNWDKYPPMVVLKRKYDDSLWACTKETFLKDFYKVEG